MPDEVLATYQERRIDGRRFFELFADRLHVRGTAQFTTEFDLTIPFNNLNPVPAKLRIRNKHFWSGVVLVALAGVADALVITFSDVARWNSDTAVFNCLGFLGAVILFLTARKVEFASFTSTSGISVIDIARSGPDTAKFDSFVTLVVTQISHATHRNA